MDWRAFPLEAMIPHRDRMRLIGRALALDDAQSVSEAIPQADWPLSDGLSVDGLVAIELVAQTAALLEGWKRLKTGRGSVSGYLVGIKSAEFKRARLPVGGALITTVTKSYALEGYAVFSGCVESAGEVVARVQIQTVRQEADPPPPAAD